MKITDWNIFFVPVAALVAPAYATDYLSVSQAQTALFPAATAFVDQSLTLDEDKRDRIKAMSGLRQRWKEQKIWRAESKGQLQGWFAVDDVIGKHEFITYAVAIANDGHVLGIEILSYREAHGEQIRQAQWRQHFVGKTVQNPFKLDEDVPNISGATLSCRNVLDGVKRLLVIHQLFLANG